MTARACTGPLGHVFAPDATFGDACACGVYQRGHGERSMLAVEPPAPRAPRRRTVRSRRRS